MKFEGKKSPRGPQRDNQWRIKGKSIAFDAAFLGGSSTWARTRDLRINSPALYRLSYRGKIGFLAKFVQMETISIGLNLQKCNNQIL